MIDHVDCWEVSSGPKLGETVGSARVLPRKAVYSEEISESCSKPPHSPSRPLTRKPVTHLLRRHQVPEKVSAAQGVQFESADEFPPAAILPIPGLCRRNRKVGLQARGAIASVISTWDSIVCAPALAGKVFPRGKSATSVYAGASQRERERGRRTEIIAGQKLIVAGLLRETLSHEKPLAARMRQVIL